MKIKDGFVLNKFADKYIAVSVFDADDEPNVLITLNKSGAYVWELLKEETTYDEVIKKIRQKYDVDEETVRADFDEFLNNARKAGLIDE